MPTDPRSQGHDPRAELREGEEAPPPGVKTMAIVRWILLVIAAAAAVATTWSFLASAQVPMERASEARYYCPMHPQITSDVHGECPICQMTLEPIPLDRRKGAAPGSAPSNATTPPAAPTGSVYMAPPTAMTPPAHAPGGATQPAAPPNRVPITLTLDRVQAIGMRTALAAMRDVTHASRVTATVVTPEQGASSVHVRAAGYVERISVEQTGVKVSKGQELVAIYSPEIFQAETELLATRSWNAGDGGLGGIVPPARQKLELLGMSSAAIDHVLATGAAMRDVSILAPANGYVAKKNVVLGSFVTPEMELYELADLSHVYIVADVPQGEMGILKVGTSARFTRRDHPGEGTEAKVDLIYPTLNLEARTTRIRMFVKNPGLELRPGEFGTVDFAAPTRRTLVVPRDAVVDLGSSVYVYVDEGKGRYTPRGVTLGVDVDADVEVRAGLSEGEHVVSGATFLLDSESALQASITGPTAVTPSGASSGSSAPVAPARGPPSVCDEKFDRSKYPDKFVECQKCEQVHRGMGTMAEDCESAIPKPWK